MTPLEDFCLGDVVMKTKPWAVLSCIVVLMCAGCASRKYELTINSDPLGGMVVCNGQNYGRAPVTVYLDRAAVKEVTLDTKITTGNRAFPVNCYVEWASGERVQLDSVRYARKGKSTFIVRSSADQTRQALDRRVQEDFIEQRNRTQALPVL